MRSHHCGLRLASRASAKAALVLVLLLAACGRSRNSEDINLDPFDPPADGEGGVGGASAEPRPDFPDTANARALTVTGMQPASGPFVGGNSALVRGSGFTEDSLVYVGGRMVQPRDTLLVDKNSLAVVIPAGDVGPADVAVEVGDESATRVDAYTYNALHLDPADGSVASGTSVLVTVAGEPFPEDGLSIEFGGEACADLKLITPRQARCKTPPGAVGMVDVIARFADEDREPIVAVESFAYMDLTDTARGGLGGGPIAGALNVTVVDSELGFVVAGAFVLVGDDLSGSLQGFTNDRGQITFSEEGLKGPLTIHVAAKCYERASLVSFDASNATVFVRPLIDPTCGMPGSPSGGGRGAAGSLISGELIFPGSDEFAVGSWDVVPPPRPGEVRVAYVYTTRVRRDLPNPSPDIGGTMARIVETGTEPGVHGYPYLMFARPAGLAVYALSGLERPTTGEFIPYVMGVARNVITAPGEETVGVDILMNIPLDRELQAQLTSIPKATPHGPDEFRVQAHVDLGGEGVIVREASGWAIDLQKSFTAGGLFRFFAQPALTGPLVDARYQVIAGWYALGGEEAPPYTEVRMHGVAPGQDPVAVEDLLGFARPTAPADGERVPDDRILRWDPSGPTPDLYIISIVGGDGFPAWTQIVPGGQNWSPLPDFTAVEGIGDISPGFLTWFLRAVTIEDFDYAGFHYGYLSDRAWSRTAFDQYTMQL